MNTFDAHSKKFIFFHGGCSDGIAAFWVYENLRFVSKDSNYHYGIPYTAGSMNLNFNVIYNHVGEKDEVKIEKVKKAIEDKIIDLENYKFGSGCDIIFLDCCPPKEVLKKMIANNRSVEIVDHHETNGRIIEETIKETTEVPEECDTLQKIIDTVDLYFNPVFDTNFSGATLAWKYYNNSQTNEAPWFIQYVADRDLWKFELPNSKMINRGMFDSNLKKDEKDNYLDMVTTTFRNYNSSICEEDSAFTIENMTKIGQRIIEEETKKIEEKLKERKELIIEGEKILGVRCQESSLISEIGNKLAVLNNSRIGLTWKSNEKGIGFSVRGIEGCTNLSKFCEKLGGGGHEHAAGFFVPYEKLIETYFSTNRTNEIKKSSKEDLFRLSLDGFHC